MRSSHHHRQSRRPFPLAFFNTLSSALAISLSLSLCVHWRRLASLEIAGRCCHASSSSSSAAARFPVSFLIPPRLLNVHSFVYDTTLLLLL
jgi:hypothetical protein